MKIRLFLLVFSFISFFSFSSEAATRDTVYLRVNQVGYLENDQKVAIAFSESALRGNFTVHNAETGKSVLRSKPVASKAPGFGNFSHYYELDFSELKLRGDITSKFLRVIVPQNLELEKPIPIKTTRKI